MSQSNFLPRGINRCIYIRMIELYLSRHSGMEAEIQVPRMASTHGNSHPCELDPGIPTGMTQSLDYASTCATIINCVSWLIIAQETLSAKKVSA